MDKRYQVFVSSTFTDLKEERQKVIRTLMEMDCIPAGMELFPAADEEQWEFIKKIIDDCDYYLLIVGGKYGSITPEGISYTEKECDYAIDIGLKVIAFIHGKPDEIPVGKSELDPTIIQKLNSFRERVAENRLVKFWLKASELPGLVALSLSKTIKMYPAVGWIRANTASNPELLEEINNLRKKNEHLETQTRSLKESTLQEIPDLASGDETYKLYGTYRFRSDGSTLKWESYLTWDQIFGYIAPHLLEHLNDATVKSKLTHSVFELTSKDGFSPHLNDDVFQTIKIQMLALGLVEVQSLNTVKGGMALFWSITEKGKALLLSIRSVKKPG